MKQILIIIFIIILNNLLGQTNALKEIFFDLPLDKTRNEIDSIVTLDTLKFKFYSTHGSEALFKVSSRRRNRFLPKSYSEPLLMLIGNELVLTLNYNSTFSKKHKAEKAFNFLSNKLTDSFSHFSDSKPIPSFDYSLFRERKFYIKDMEEPKCIIKLEQYLGSIKLKIIYYTKDTD